MQMAVPLWPYQGKTDPECSLVLLPAHSFNELQPVETPEHITELVSRRRAIQPEAVGQSLSPWVKQFMITLARKSA